jgi:Tfp pilus assembly protein PilF
MGQPAMMLRGLRLVMAATMSLACHGIARGGPVTWTSADFSPVRLPEGIAEINRAIESFKRRDFVQCQVLLKSAVANHPDLPPAPIMFANVCIRLDQPAMGRVALEEAAVRYSEFPELYLLFGRLALDDNHITDAELQFDKAATLSASDRWSGTRRERFLVQVYEGLLTVAEKRQDWAAASANSDAWLKLEPKNGRARARMAEAMFHQRKRETARLELEQAVNDDPSLGPATVLMARFCTDEGDLQTASHWMRAAVEQAPKDPIAHLRYATWLFEHGDAIQARSEADTVIRLDPGNVQADGLRGLIARSLKDYSAAARIFQDIYTHHPEKFAASNQLALCLAEGQSDEQRGRAWKIAEANAKRLPTSAEAQTTYGWVAFRMGKSDQAERSLRTALGKGKGTSETAFYLASVLAHLGKNDEVPELLKISLSASGTFVFRKEAQAWLDRIEQARARDSPRTK